MRPRFTGSRADRKKKRAKWWRAHRNLVRVICTPICERSFVDALYPQLIFREPWKWEGPMYNVIE